MSSQKPERTLRADAARNRQAILEAAEELLAGEGAGLSTEAVAERAGVGVGTVFRHFATKAALLRSVVRVRVERLTNKARELGVDAEDDALLVFFETVVAHTAATSAIHYALSELGADADAVLRDARREFMAALGQLVTRAQDRGLVRRDVDVGDVFALLAAVVHAGERSGRDAERVRRVLTVVTDGLRCRP